MYNFDLSVWGAFLSGLGTLLLAVVAVAVVVWDIRIRQRQLRETDARGIATLNAVLDVTIEKKPTTDSLCPEWVLETRVTLNNQSSEVWVVPAVYVQARTIPACDCTLTEDEFDSLPVCGMLSRPVNAAHFSTSMFAFGPNEVDSVFRWDIMSNDFVQRFPAIIVRTEIYIAPHKLLGWSNNVGTPVLNNSIRNEWLDFIRSDRCRYKNPFRRAQENIANGIEMGQWYIIEEDSLLPDLEKTKVFRKVLDLIVKTGCQKLLVLRQCGITSIHTD